LAAGYAVDADYADAVVDFVAPGPLQCADRLRRSAAVELVIWI
jgi:hypothetical protein